MNNKMNAILEECLQAIEQGETIETTLIRYPKFANELRPILEAAVSAKNMAMFTVSADVVRRNRTKLLHRAAQMREDQPVTMKQWFPSFQRLTIALVLMLLFFVSGTSLVRASSLALPGDSLYSVKRSWEDVRLLFAFNTEARETLEIEYENERLDELNMLFASGRPAKVDFAGIVTRQNGDGWRVANILVIVSEQTTLPDQPVAMGAAVRVTGTTKGDGIVLAERIELLPVGVPLPEVKDDDQSALDDQPVDAQPLLVTKQPAATPQPNNGNPDTGSVTAAPEINETKIPEPTSTPKAEAFMGILRSINKDLWTVDNIVVNVANAQIDGIPVIGASAKVEGRFNSKGIFIATKIKIINNGSGDNNVNSNINDSSDNSNGDDNNNEGNGNGNDNDDVNDNNNHATETPEPKH